MGFCSPRFRREVFVSRTEPPTHGVETGYGIASVFTPPEKRGKGYAKHMMRLLHWVIAKPDARPSKFPEAWGEPPAKVEGFMNASLSVLYSDVGTDFYASCGFLPGTHDGWNVAPRASTCWKVSVESGAQREWKWLGQYDLDAYWQKDSEEIAGEMKELDLKGKDAAFSFTPRHGVGVFHPLRVQQFIEEAGPMSTFYGVALKSLEGTLAYASWTFEFPSFKKLVITRLRVPLNLLEELISVIMGYCKERGMEEIEVWNLPKELVSRAASMGATTSDMKDHLPSLKWYSSTDESVEWVNNEK